MKAFAKNKLINLNVTIDKKATAKRISELIHKFGKPIDQLLDSFNVMDKQAIYYWMSEKNGGISIEKAKLLAVYMGIDIDDIIIFKGDEPKEVIQKYKRIEKNIAISLDYMISSEKTGEKITQLMREKNCSVKELAEIMGVSETTVRNWKKGTLPKWPKLKKLSIVFGVKMNDIIKVRKDGAEGMMNIF